MEFHYYPTSHWSRILALVLAEKGLEPTRRHVDITANATFEPAYIRLNPRGVVPTLVLDDGEVVCNGPEIAKRLDAVAEPVLCPDEPEVRRWAERLEAFPAMLLSYAEWTQGKRGERSAEILDDKVDRARRYAERYPDLRAQYERKRKFFESFRAEVYDTQGVERARRAAASLLEDLSARVEAGYVAGERYTFPDAIATAVLFRLVDLGTVDAWSSDPAHALARYWKRLRARPSFKAVFFDDPLIAPKYRPPSSLLTDA